MYWCTEDATMLCPHKPGFVQNYGSAQTWVTIGGRRVLIAPDTIGRDIKGCPNIPPIGPKQCLKTIGVTQGYSGLIKVDNAPVCLDNLQGPCDAPFGPYSVMSPAQQLVGTDT